MTKKINPNLTAEQKLILFEEGTELAGSSELNHEKREEVFIVQTVGKNYLTQRLNMKAGLMAIFYESDNECRLSFRLWKNRISL